MTAASFSVDRPSGVSPRRPAVASNAVVGMAIFLAAEIMFFGALISAFTITRISTPGAWPPPGQPRLPIEATAVNTGVLLASGVALYFAHRHSAQSTRRAAKMLGVAVGLGAAFVLFQGWEWVQLIREGLTMRSGPAGSYFYLLVGAHALHAVAGLVALAIARARALRDALGPGLFTSARLYWYFVVGLWPVLYWRVYL
ncbi:MAG: cytochrome c oxidase subunit 3 [Polyangiaceae bacterium]|nr:cytochrome c oxidase subunit 3 [Polyangiaceae bacterium]